MILILAITAAGCAADKSDKEPSAVDETAQTAASAASTEAQTTLTRDPDAVYEYETRVIRCENNGNSIYGEAYIPQIDGVDKYPLVIHSHGMGSNREAGEDFCKRYAEKGFAGYTFDFPGGSKPDTENLSDGDPLKMSVKTETSDLQAILDTALTWDFVDTDNVFLEGGSQGGLVSTLIGLDNKDKVKGMILMYPALQMAEAISSRFNSPDDVPDTVSIGDDYTLGGVFVRDLFDIECMSRLHEFEGPVVIIHGSEDSLVSADVSEQAVELFPNAELHIIKGAGHGFGGEDFEKAAGYALDYLFKNAR